MRLLDRVASALASAEGGACLQSTAFARSSSLPASEVPDAAAATLSALTPIMAARGIKMSHLGAGEIHAWCKTDKAAINATEYQELVGGLAKLAALQASSRPARRWSLVVALSAAGALAAAAGLRLVPAAKGAAGKEVLLASAPVGAAVGALAVCVSSVGRGGRQRRRASKHVQRQPKPAAARTRAEGASEPVALEPAAPASPAAASPTSSGGRTDEFASAVVALAPVAASPAKAGSAVSPSKPAAASLSSELPVLPRASTPDAPLPGGESPLMASPRLSMDAAPRPSAELPPLKRQKSAGAKAMSKMSKSFKKMTASMKASASGSSIEAAAALKPPSGFASFRRSFSRDSRRDTSDCDSGALVEPSKGSETLVKMKDLFRRSFERRPSLASSTPRASVDAGAPPVAGKRAGVLQF